MSSIKDFATLILPFLNTLDFNTSGETHKENVSYEIKLHDLLYRISIIYFDNPTETEFRLISNPHLYNRNPDGYTISCWVYLQSQCQDWKKSSDNYYFDKYIINYYRREKSCCFQCIECNRSLKTNFKKHLLTHTHTTNVKKYKQVIKPILLELTHLNENNINEILSFL